MTLAITDNGKTIDCDRCGELRNHIAELEAEVVKLQNRIKELEDDRHIRREIAEDICSWGKDTCG